MWKGLTVNVSASFYWGGKRYNSTIIDRVEVGRTTLMAQNVDARALYDRWQKPGDIVPFRKYDDSSTRATSRFVMDDKVFEIQSVGLLDNQDGTGYQLSFCPEYSGKYKIFILTTG